MNRKNICTKCNSKDLECESGWPDFVSVLPVKCLNCGYEMQHSPIAKYLCFTAIFSLCIGIVIGPLEYWFSLFLLLFAIFGFFVSFGQFKEYEHPSKTKIARQGIFFNIVLSVLAGSYLYIDGLSLWSGMLLIWVLWLWLYGIWRYANSTST